MSGECVWLVCGSLVVNGEKGSIMVSLFLIGGIFNMKFYGMFVVKVNVFAVGVG